MDLVKVNIMFIYFIYYVVKEIIINIKVVISDCIKCMEMMIVGCYFFFK